MHSLPKNGGMALLRHPDPTSLNMALGYGSASGLRVSACYSHHIRIEKVFFAGVLIVKLTDGYFSSFFY